jgi:type II secretion system protein G
MMSNEKKGSSGTKELSTENCQLKTDKGFTILELLVVVAIIGILAAVSMALLSDTRARSRDARRLSDMREIEKALNLYYAENGHFPDEDGTDPAITGSDDVSTALEGADLISETPTDPLHPTYTYRYESADTTDFTLFFCLETDTIQGFNSDCDNTIIP